MKMLRVNEESLQEMSNLLIQIWRAKCGRILNQNKIARYDMHRIYLSHYVTDTHFVRQVHHAKRAEAIFPFAKSKILFF